MDFSEMRASSRRAKKREPMLAPAATAPRIPTIMARGTTTTKAINNMPEHHKPGIL